MPTYNNSTDAFRKQLLASHTPEQISFRLKNKTEHNYLRDFVYGAVDGTITTFAVVSGVAGAHLAPQIIIILGLANLIADGFSMAVSNFLGTRTEKQIVEKAREEENAHIKVYPEGETEEIRQIFANKGFGGENLERAVAIITSDSNQWTETMLKEEYELSLQPVIAWKAASATFSSFILLGIIPVLPFIWNYFFTGSIRNPFLWSSIATGIAFFIIGTIKGRFTNKPWFASGSETFLLGGTAATLSYIVGILLKEIK